MHLNTDDGLAYDAEPDVKVGLQRDVCIPVVTAGVFSSSEFCGTARVTREDSGQAVCGQPHMGSLSLEHLLQVAEPGGHHHRRTGTMGCT